jgi:hypothetical protein
MVEFSAHRSENAGVIRRAALLSIVVALLAFGCASAGAAKGSLATARAFDRCPVFWSGQEARDLRVEDDLGTAYRGKGLTLYGAGWSGNAPTAHYPMEFGPAVPAEARYLRITFGSMYDENRTVVVML